MNESTRSNFSLVTSSVSDILHFRATVISSIRNYFYGLGYLEVDTPLLLPTVATEEHIEPFSVDGVYLATSPEMEMKRLVAAGSGPVFQFSRSFRRGEFGRLHSPEFMLLEWYCPGSDLVPLIQTTDGLLRQVVQDVHGTRSFVTASGQRIHVGEELRVTPVRDAFLNYAGWDPVANFEANRFDLDLTSLVEPRLGQGAPEVLAWYPVEAASLAEVAERLPGVREAQRMEVYVDGIELANGFVELRDAEEQKRRFAEAAERIALQGRRPPPMPTDYLNCLEYLPPTVGIALGVERLMMLLGGFASIHDVRRPEVMAVPGSWRRG